MSWNPTRYARVLDKRMKTDNAELLWLTNNAFERVSQGVETGAVELTSVPFPTTTYVGLPQGSPLSEYGIAFFAMHVETPEEMKETAKDDPLFAEVLNTPEIQSSVRVYDWVCMDERGEFVSVIEEVILDHQDEMNRVITHASGFADEEYLYETLTMCTRMLLSSWTLFNEPDEREVCATVRETVQVVSKSARKRSKGRPSPSISVLDIKRGASNVRYIGAGRQVEHDHRWEVRGHWRNQPHGPGRSERRMQWIDSFVCGPDDKPLVKKPKVYKVS